MAQGYGRIINLGSQLSVTASRGRSSYCASKFGVAGNLALVEDDMALGIDTGGHERRGDFARVVGEFAGLLPDRDRV